MDLLLNAFVSYNYSLVSGIGRSMLRVLAITILPRLFCDLRLLKSAQRHHQLFHFIFGLLLYIWTRCTAQSLRNNLY